MMVRTICYASNLTIADTVRSHQLATVRSLQLTTVRSIHRCQNPASARDGSHYLRCFQPHLRQSTSLASARDGSHYLRRIWRRFNLFIGIFYFLPQVWCMRLTLSQVSFKRRIVESDLFVGFGFFVKF